MITLAGGGQVWFVSDVPPGPDEMAALRAANARLRQVVEAKDVEISVLREQVEALSAQMAELRARLGKSPRNSSQPPSSEGPGRPASGSLRRKSGRKPGRPRGQPGAALEMTSCPDVVVRHDDRRYRRGIDRGPSLTS